MLIKKMLGMHKINDYALVEYTSGGAGLITLCRDIGNSNFKDINNNRIINVSQISFYKTLTSYVGVGKGFITDLKAKKLAEPFYDNFHKEWLDFMDEINKTEKGEYLSVLGICVM